MCQSFSICEWLLTKQNIIFEKVNKSLNSVSVFHSLVQGTWYRHLLKNNDWSTMYRMQFYLLICADLKLGLLH